jgi:hypothetical protein
MLSECRSIFVDYVTVPKPSGLGMVSSFKASVARVFSCVFSPIDARRIWRFWKITMLDLVLLHLHIWPRVHEELHDALSGFLSLGLPQQGLETQLVAFGFRTGLALGCADFAGHDGWCWICSTASGTQRLLR